MKKNIVLNNETVEIDVLEQSATFVLFKFNGEEYAVNLESNRDGKLSLKYGEKITKVIKSDDTYVVLGKEIKVALPNRSRNKAKAEHAGAMISPMPGKILKIFKAVGDTVIKGEPILVMEAMKMEHTIRASEDGKIEHIFYKEGDQVVAKVDLVKLC